MKLSSLTVRFVLIALVLFVGFVVVSTGGLFFQVRSMARDLGVRYAEERVETAKARISGRLQREAALAQKLAGSPTVKRWMQDENNEQLREHAFAELASYRDAFVDSNYFVAVDESKHYYNRPRNEELMMTTLSADEPADEWYFATLDAARRVSFNLDYNAELDVSRVWINCLVTHEDEIIGVAGTGLEITDFVSRFLSQGATAGGTMMIRLDGTIFAHPDEDIMEQNARTPSGEDKISAYDLVAEEGDRETLRALASRAIAGNTAVAPVEFEDNALVTAVTRLPGLDALLLESVDIAAFVSPRDFVPLFILVAAVILVAVGVLAFVVEHRVLVPLSGLTDSARRIADGEYHLSIPDTERKDEIGTLSAAFENMAEQVAAYTTRLEHMVEERTRELTEANRTLTESIRYAQLIQDGVMADDEALGLRFPAHKLFFRERDLVGGDFLFLRSTEDGGFLIAVIDCEGHGVSGALMTMMADSFLRHIVATRDPRDPAGILAHTERAVAGSLSGTNGEGSFTSGFDIGLCGCFPAEHKVVFAGAGMPLYVRDADGTVSTIPGRRKAIRSHHRKEPTAFENHEISTDARTFFMVTDGFVDQSGGTDGRSYGTERLKKLLSAAGPGRLKQSTNFWQEAFDSYRGAHGQRDDVLAVGFTLVEDSKTMGGEETYNG